MEINCQFPINNVSFGQISTSYLRFLFEKKYDLNLIPIGNQLDFSAQDDISKEFLEWVKNSSDKFLSSWNRKNKLFKLWHLNGSLESYSNHQILFSFYELDSPTKEELNIVKNNNKVLFSSKYTCDIFKSFGVDNVDHLPLFFDSLNFFRKDKKYFDGRITFNLAGKFEKRKHHEKIIKIWLKKYGNNPKYSLQCAIYNPFFEAKDNQSIIRSILDGRNYFNINFLQFMPTNKLYNDYLNSGDIIIGMSGGEGWGLPEFHSLCLGKHGVILNAHSYKEWADKDNAVLVNPSNKKIDVYDGIFFHKGQKFNQGQIFDFDEEEFIFGCEEAIKKFEISSVNVEGLSLQNKFTINNMHKNIIKFLA